MKANDLYAMDIEYSDEPVIEILADILDNNEYYIYEGDLWSVREKLEYRIKHKIVHHHGVDYRRYWELGTLWFDDKPVGVIQRAGREGDDHKDEYFTDIECYLEMIKFIKKTLIDDGADDLYQTNPDADIPTLTSFYGRTLGDN